MEEKSKHGDEVCHKTRSKKTNVLVVIIMFSCIFCSCISYRYGANQPTQKSNLTFGTVKSQIVKGKTTQTEILQLFGAPNLVTKNKSNNEVWSYNRMTTTTKGGYSSFIDGERASVSTSNQSFDLIIIFNFDDIVQDYSVVSSSI